MTAAALNKKAHVPFQSQKPSYLRTRKKTNLYVPSINSKGISCEGDRFDYVVPWEINEDASSKKLVK